MEDEQTRARADRILEQLSDLGDDSDSDADSDCESVEDGEDERQRIEQIAPISP